MKSKKIVDHIADCVQEAHEDWLLRKRVRSILKRAGVPRSRKAIEHLIEQSRHDFDGEMCDFITICLKNYFNIYCCRRSIEWNYKVFSDLDFEMRKWVLYMNREKGKSYERQAKLMVQSMVKSKYELESDIVVDEKVFACIMNGKKRSRRVDLFIPSHRAMIEVKSGRLHNRSSVRRQVRIDRKLLDQGVVDNAKWYLFFGGSPPILDFMDANAISFWDLGFGLKNQMMF